MKTPHFNDPPRMPGTDESPEERWAQSPVLSGTPGQRYVERRGIPVQLAEAAGLRFDADFGGRPAVVCLLRDRDGQAVSLHGRYLETRRGQNKMLTIGSGGGAAGLRGGWRAEPLILVEGLFDALSLAVCGWASVATIGRWAPWLPAVAAGREVWLGFDAGRPGEAEANRYAARLPDSSVIRLPPPPRCLDWNTALVKRGPSQVAAWIRDQLAAKQAPA